MSAIKDFVAENFPRYLDFYQDVVRAESPTKDKKAVDHCAEVVAEFCRKEGLNVFIKEFSHCGNFLKITCNEDAPGKPILLLAHIDTVHPIGAFGKEPVVIEGNLLHGPGSVDCKGGVVSAIFAMKTANELGIKRKIIMLISGAEEDIATSGPECAKWMVSEARGGLCCMNAEPYVPGKLTVGRKGILTVKIEIHGKASHAGSGYDLGISSIKEACQKILEIESESDMKSVTYNCGVISGGSVSNTVPEFCEFLVDVRIPDLASRERALARLEKICAHSYLEGTTTKMTLLGNRPPMEHTAGNDKLFDLINSVCEEIGYGKNIPITKGGGSDSCFTVQAGVPTICSVGAVGDGGHRLDEAGEIDSVPRSAELIAEVISRVPEDFAE